MQGSVRHNCSAPEPLLDPCLCMPRERVQASPPGPTWCAPWLARDWPVMLGQHVRLGIRPAYSHSLVPRKEAMRLAKPRGEGCTRFWTVGGHLSQTAVFLDQDKLVSKANSTSAPCRLPGVKERTLATRAFRLAVGKLQSTQSAHRYLLAKSTCRPSRRSARQAAEASQRQKSPTARAVPSNLGHGQRSTHFFHRPVQSSANGCRMSTILWRN